MNDLENEMATKPKEVVHTHNSHKHVIPPQQNASKASPGDVGMADVQKGQAELQQLASQSVGTASQPSPPPLGRDPNWRNRKPSKEELASAQKAARERMEAHRRAAMGKQNQTRQRRIEKSTGMSMAELQALAKARNEAQRREMMGKQNQTRQRTKREAGKKPEVRRGGWGGITKA